MRRLRTGPVFEARLLEIARYFEENGSQDRYFWLLAALESPIFPNIQRFPSIGRLFDPKRGGLTGFSVEWEHFQVLLAKEMGKADVREYIAGEYLILYAVNETDIYVLSIRHFRQREAGFGPM